MLFLCFKENEVYTSCHIDIRDMIFKGKVRLILVCSDYSPLYIITHTYYSYVYVIAE